MYFPLLNVAPLSPWRCLLARSSAVLERVTASASIRLIRFDNSSDAVTGREEHTFKRALAVAGSNRPCSTPPDCC